MKKLALEMEHLAVESFSTLPRQVAGYGTVRGQEAGPTIPSCPSLNLCPTEACPTGDCPTSATTLCRC
ncbi:hypothetical protein [Longimicrobium sp.]|uniref:hypothetical protein n=1 Tax=Longimicrobium sp. TaxID=2029185 RepID=UPI002C807B6B|nr:hypothetical protein [Longimicrobium sp.]HSU13473.1 hypothetical protein [Longimicrobium sp.]